MSDIVKAPNHQGHLTSKHEKEGDLKKGILANIISAKYDSGFEVQENITYTVLSLKLKEIRALKDHHHSTKELVFMAMDNSDEVEAVESICRYFKVKKFSSISKKMLDSARAKHSKKLIKPEIKSAIKPLSSIRYLRVLQSIASALEELSRFSFRLSESRRKSFGSLVRGHLRGVKDSEIQFVLKNPPDKFYSLSI